MPNGEYLLSTFLLCIFFIFLTQETLNDNSLQASASRDEFFAHFYFHPQRRLSIHVVASSRTRTGTGTVVPYVHLRKEKKNHNPAVEWFIAGDKTE